MKGCVFMTHQYSLSLKKKLSEDICLHGKSTLKTAEQYGIPLKTLEKWITAFNKDHHCFDPTPDKNDFHLASSLSYNEDYEDMSIDELKKELMKKDIELARLKKGYMVKGDGTGEKVFITFSKKNTK